MNRRSFLKHSAAIAGVMCMDMPTFAEKIKTFGDVKLKIGILSDVHIATEENVPMLRKAFEYFRDKEVDGVLVAGDIADWGWESQFKMFADCWFSVFPKDKLPNGKHVERLFCYGNHDMRTAKQVIKKYKTDPAKSEAEAIIPRKEEVWKKYFKEKFSPIYMKDVKGYKFIGAHFDGFLGIQQLDDYLQSVKGEIGGSRPFFYFQHMHPKDTCSAPWTWGQDDGKTTAALSKFPNAISFSGHSHTPLADERTIWQGAFTSVGTGSLSYLYPFGGRENSMVCLSKENVNTQMPRMKCQDGKNGMLMTVYADKITLQRHDFVYDDEVGDNWVISLPYEGERGLAFDTRANKSIAPQFAADARVTTTEGHGADRHKQEHDQIIVHFPTAHRKGDAPRAFDYEIQAEVHDVDFDKIALTKRVYSPKFYLSDAHDTEEVVCPFALDELPNNREVRFYVRPCNCFGKKGAPIVSDWTLVKQKTE